MMTLLKIGILAWLGLGCTAMILPARRSIAYCCRCLTIFVALFTLFLSVIYPHSFPWLFNTKLFPNHLKFGFQFDPLSRFFVFLLSLSTSAIACFGQSYFRYFSLKQQKMIQITSSFFILAMLMVLTAANVFTFLFAWELMTLSSYFLVVFNSPDKCTRHAGLLYLGIAHLGFLSITSSFFLLTNSTITILSANFIFILMLIGFAAKSGLFPFHIWLPEAHPAAPSPISALMSGVMLKTAIYGLIRFSFYWLLPYQQVWWGYLLIAIGLGSMLIGVIHAALQTDMKRLLAYSSMENMGFIALSLGFAIVFYQFHQYNLSNITLLIVLLHSLSHSLFKSLLFLSTGSILHATGERNMGKLGGLIKKIPWVSACTLIGCFSMAGLPLFSGFISEWLYLRIFFTQTSMTHFNFSIFSSIIVVVSVLVFSLAGFVIVKFFGIAFLGHPRESQLAHAKATSWFERLGLGWLVLWNLLIGLWPTPFILLLQKILSTISNRFTLTWSNSLTFSLSYPNTNNSVFIPLFLLIVLIISLLAIYLLIKKYAMPAVQKNIAWSCGFNTITPRMQESSEGFSQPFRLIFARLIQTKFILPKAADANPHYVAHTKDRIWPLFYRPVIKSIFHIVSLTKWIQQGKIAVYLTYVALTLFILLLGVLWI